MTQVSPEGNINFPEYTLRKNPEDFEENMTFDGIAEPLTTTRFGDDATGPTTSDIIQLSEDILRHQTPITQFAQELGPKDATNEDRGLLEHQLKDLAKIAVINFPLYDKYRAQAVTFVTKSVNSGNLRLGADFRNMNADEQIQQFVSKNVSEAYEPPEAVIVELTARKEELRLGSSGLERLLQAQLNEKKETIRKQGVSILAVRHMLKKRGATDDFLRDYDYEMKLMSKPEREAYEREKELTPDAEAALLVNTGEVKTHGSFLDILRRNFAKESLRRVGILAPRSAEVRVIAQSEKVLS